MVPILDEIELKKMSVAQKIAEKPPVVSATYMMGLSKTASGSYINNLDVPTALLPGNFGVRVIDRLIPTNFSDVHRDRRSTLVQEFACDNHVWEIPEILEEPNEVDYLTDEESDDGEDFEVPVPDLMELIHGFENSDDKIQKDEASAKIYAEDLRDRGLEMDPREEIKLVKLARYELLDSNITEHRRLVQAALPGMIEDLHEVVTKPQNKTFVR